MTNFKIVTGSLDNYVRSLIVDLICESDLGSVYPYVWVVSVAFICRSIGSK